jgi:hypothetical protein
MSKPTDRPAAHFEVENADEAFRKLEDFTRRVLAVQDLRPAPLAGPAEELAATFGGSLRS